MNQTRRIILHVIADWTAATLSWLGLFLFRKSFIEASKHGYEIPVNHDDNLLLGLHYLQLLQLHHKNQDRYLQQYLQDMLLLDLQYH